jgi:hypothetical protein
VEQVENRLTEKDASSNLIGSSLAKLFLKIRPVWKERIKVEHFY